jgi:hypothetical protein
MIDTETAIQKLKELQKEIFETQTKGAGTDEVFIQAEVQAFRAAFLKLLSESAFVDALKSR